MSFRQSITRAVRRAEYEAAVTAVVVQVVALTVLEDARRAALPHAERVLYGVWHAAAALGQFKQDVRRARAFVGV